MFLKSTHFKRVSTTFVPDYSFHSVGTIPEKVDLLNIKMSRIEREYQPLS